VQRKAFTLIELLVVIAIIAILAAILFPVFAQAKLAAKKAASLSNIKQNILGELMYTNDFDDKFDSGCGESWWYPNMDGGWSYAIYPYEKNLAILRDPTDPLNNRNDPTWEFPPDNPGVITSYVSNGYMYQDTTYATHMDGVMGMSQTWMVGGVAGRTIVGQVTQPAQTVAFAVRFGSCDLWGLNDMVTGVTWWDYGNGGPGMIPNGAANPNTPYKAQDAHGVTYTVNADYRNGAIANTYAGQSPFAFTDGHAKSMVPMATNPNPLKVNILQPWSGPGSVFVNQHDPNNMWDAYR